jgi:hypothetical protein
MRDTTPDAEEVRAAVLRRLSGPERLRIAFELSDTTRAMALARLRERWPTLTQRELVGRLLRELYSAGELPPAFR